MFDLLSVVGMEDNGIHAPPDSSLGLFMEFDLAFELGNGSGDVIEVVLGRT